MLDKIEGEWNWSTKRVIKAVNTCFETPADNVLKN